MLYKFTHGSRFFCYVEALCQQQKKKLVLSDIEVREYGYSKVLWELCPQGWKDAVGDEWEDVLKTLILKWSPQTYLGKDYAAFPCKRFFQHIPDMYVVVNNKYFSHNYTPALYLVIFH